MSLGPVMLDISGAGLTAMDRQRLQHPQVGGVILFSRNYESPAQLTALVEEIHALRRPPLVVAVDQEGGRVQRFRQGFQTLPTMASLGHLYDTDQARALRLTTEFAWLMATELLHHGIDFSFSPVLDIGDPVSTVIGDRAFHRHPDTIALLGKVWVDGLRKAGMQAVGKHFPGHGLVAGDSHQLLPVDKRSFNTIKALDLIPFQKLSGCLGGMMMAHVIYDQVDPHAAGYSSHWIQHVLREQLGFEGVVFSDDLSMGGAESAGDHAERARLALLAGCDIVLICNHPEGADAVLNFLGDDRLSPPWHKLRSQGGTGKGWSSHLSGAAWQQAVTRLAEFNQQTHSNKERIELC